MADFVDDARQPNPKRPKPTAAALMKALRMATPAEVAEFKALFADVLRPPVPTAKGQRLELSTLDVDAIKTDITDAVKAALAEATKGLIDEVAALKKMAAPAPTLRQPAKARPGTGPGTSAYYRRLAAETTDPAVAERYATLAFEAQRKEWGQ